MKKLSVVLATRNEEQNVGRCLEAVKDIADEIIIFDEQSTDKTVEIARSFGAKVYSEPHHDNFHITKQKAIDSATREWILQLDADEVITPALASEIKKVIEMSDEQILVRRPESQKIWQLMKRHERLIEQRDGMLGKKTGEVVAFFIPRRNVFLGKPLIHAGVYPDPAIRLIKNGKAKLPAKSVHEIMQIDGQVAWLFNDMLHFDSPTLARYLSRMNRYTDLNVAEFRKRKLPKNSRYFILYTIYKPLVTFVKLYFRHKGFLDGIRGFLWSAFSALHFPLAYFKYVTNVYNTNK